jgi:integrase
MRVGGGFMRSDNPAFTGPFASMCEAYVRQKRAFGIQYNGQIWALRRFDTLAKDFDIQDFVITRELASAWMVKSPNESTSYYNNRLYIMWQFADFLVQQGYDSYLSRLKLRKASTHTPYIFRKDELGKMFAELDKMEYSPCSPKKHVMFPVLYRMLYGCGLRISEALHLTIKDVDVENRMIHVASGKNDKERLVPMCNSLAQRCSAFVAKVHDKHNATHLFFYSRDGKPYSVSNIEKHFRALLCDVDIPYCGKDLGPRLHDIRHTFVCHRLNDWARTGVDLMTRLPVLSKYLGHENVAGTQWYLKLTAEAYPDIIEKMNELAGYVFPEAGGEYVEEL